MGRQLMSLRLTNLSSRDDEFFLGQDGDKNIAFGGPGALISIGRPGSGKTQCHAMTNLLNWSGSALVLDIKGELYDKTHKWREQNVGPVIRFSPFKKETARYNPLAFISSQPVEAWSQGKFLAEMLIPSADDEGNQKFWNDSAREIIGAAIAAICVNLSPQDRSFDKVLDIVSCKGWAWLIEQLIVMSEASGLRAAARTVANFEDQRVNEPRLFTSSRTTAYVAINSWSDPNLEFAISASDWSPNDLHGDKPLTVYITASPQQLATQRNFFRLVIGQHINMLMDDQFLQDHGKDKAKRQVLLLLDEFPTLGYMKPIEESIALGRQYGLRPWLLAQYAQQITKAYASDAVIQTCAVRSYMNPDFETAKQISDEFGYINDINGSGRRPLHEPQKIVGPDHKNTVFVFATNWKATLLSKVFAGAADGPFSSRYGNS
jgi:type IV secretion system protein VirD4